MKIKYSKSEIAKMIKEAESGKNTLKEICKKRGISISTFYRLKKMNY